MIVSAAGRRPAEYNHIYKAHSHRIYSLAFWMTENELAAEELARNTFLRAFSAVTLPGPDQIDQAFLAEVRELMPLGRLQLNCAVTAGSLGIRGRLKRIHLEQAVVQLPPTERLIFLLHDVEGYPHERTARLLGVSEKESRSAVFQARARIRELIARM